MTNVAIQGGAASKPQPTHQRASASQILLALMSRPEGAAVALNAAELAAQLGAPLPAVKRSLDSLVAEHILAQGEGDGHPVFSLRTPNEEISRFRRHFAAQPRARLALDASAASAVQDALELYCRIGIGQIGEVASRARFTEIKHADGTPLTSEQLQEVDTLADALKFHLLGLQSNASFGIYGERVHADVLQTWALQRALRHRLAWDREPGGSIGVWHDEPLIEDSIPGLLVLSQQPDANGKPAHYTVELPVACLGLLQRALRTALRVTTGDAGAIVDLARDQLLRNHDGAVVSPQALAKADLLAAALGATLSGVEGRPYDAQLSPRQTNVLAVLKALDQFLQAPSAVAESHCAEASGQQVTVIKISETDDVAWAHQEMLPAGMVLNFRAPHFRVIAADQQHEEATIVASSHSPQTAVQMARNRAQGLGARTTTF